METKFRFYAIIISFFMSFGFVSATSLTSCGTLSTANAYYFLQNNVTNDTRCFTVSANNVTIDLNNSAITFDNSSTASLIYGIYVTGNNFVLKNGLLEQGAGNGIESTAIYVNTISNLNISNMRITTYGTNAKNIYISESKNISITDNDLYQNVTNCTDRSNKVVEQIGVGGQKGGYLLIQRNNITGYGQMGISMGRSSAGDNWGLYDVYGNLTEVDVSYNYINMTAVVSNGFAMDISGYAAFLTDGVYYIPKIHDNNIRQTNARGIDIDAIDDLLGMRGAWIYNNYVDTQESCKTDNLGGNYNRTPVCRTMSLSIRGCDAFTHAGDLPCNPYGENTGLNVSNNVFIVREGNTVPNQPYYAYPYATGRLYNDNVTRGGIAFRLINQDFNGTGNSTYTNNTFAAYRNTTNNDLAGLFDDGDTYFSTGLYLNGILPGNNYVFKDNTYIGAEYPLWIDASDITFINEKIVNTSINANNFKTILYGYYASNVINNIFYNTSFVNITGGFDSVYYSTGSPGGLMNYTAKWYLNTTVTDLFGNPLSDAAITFYDLQNKVETTGITDVNGTYLSNLTQFTEECDYSNCRALGHYYRNYTTPHNVSVTYEGAIQNQTINMTNSTTLAFTFDTGSFPAEFVVNITDPINNSDYVYGTNFTLNVTIVGNASVYYVKYSLDGATNTSMGLVQNNSFISANLGILDGGLHNITVYGKNSSVTNSSYVNFSVSPATQWCNLTLNGVEANLTIPEETLATAIASASNVSGMLYRDGVLIANPNAATLVNGTYNYTYFSAGNANYTSCFKTWFLNVTYVNPEIYVWSPLNQTYSQTNYNITLNVTGNKTMSVFWYQLNNSGVNVTFTTVINITTGNGSNYLQIWANDSIGAVVYNATYFTMNVTVTTPLPTVTPGGGGGSGSTPTPMPSATIPPVEAGITPISGDVMLGLIVIVVISLVLYIYSRKYKKSG